MAVNDLDVFAAAGGIKKALIIEVPAVATNGVVSIELTSVMNNPMINGIELVYANGGSPMAPPTPPAPAPVQPPAAPPVVKTLFSDILINCGGAAYLEASGLRTWQADKFFTGGNIYHAGNKEILNTEDDVCVRFDLKVAARYAQCFLLTDGRCFARKNFQRLSVGKVRGLLLPNPCSSG